MNYYSLNKYLKNTFGEKVYKISLNANMTCPNRDGTLGTRGCIFCSRGGSGEFASDALLPVHRQIDQAKLRIKKNPTVKSLLHTFSRSQIPMRLLNILKKYLQMQFQNPTLLLFQSQPVPIAWEIMC